MTDLKGWEDPGSDCQHDWDKHYALSGIPNNAKIMRSLAQAERHPAYCTGVGSCHCEECLKWRLSLLIHNSQMFRGAKHKYPNWDFTNNCPMYAKDPWAGVKVQGEHGPIAVVTKPGMISTIIAPPGGSTCRKCKYLNPDAGPNQEDGTYVCFQCR